MIVMHSKLLNENIVIIEKPEELEAAEKKAQELDAAIFTLREAQWAAEGVPDENKKEYLMFATKIKKTFNAFFRVPDDFRTGGKG